MTSTKNPSQSELSIQQERDAIHRAGRLHWFHWVIVALSLLLTLAAWQFAKNQQQQKALGQFQRQSDHVIELVQERMRKYEDALWSGIAAIQANGGDMNYPQWKTFAKSLHIEKTYPGISGIGIIEYVRAEDLSTHTDAQHALRPDYSVHPKTESPEHMPIVFIEPETPNAAAVGLDMTYEQNRYQAAKKARISGKAQITGPIFLVQEAEQTPGFLFYAPYYAGGIYNTVEDRRRHFDGMVYAPFTVSKLIAGTLRKENRQIAIRLSDGDAILYDELVESEPEFDRRPLYESNQSVEIYGRNWNFDLQTMKSFRGAYNTNEPALILLGGLLIDAMLLGLFVLLTKANRRSLEFADRMTKELKIKATALSKSNDELERFAYVTSHDLKTPLRGISDLASYIEEDLNDLTPTDGKFSEIFFNVNRIHGQTKRMENLINGILDYSSVGTQKEPLEETNVEAILDDLISELHIRSDQLIAVGSLPQFMTYRTRFAQVLNNLIGNAFKYHPDPDSALVTVSCTQLDGLYEFAVTDNGNGIDPRFHERIFEVFQTLQSRDVIESTGVGLSIVKKSVESLGGNIEVLSKVGEGTTFQFTWPITVPQKQPRQLEFEQ